jgi:hypothetical protein
VRVYLKATKVVAEAFSERIEKMAGNVHLTIFFFPTKDIGYITLVVVEKLRLVKWLPAMVLSLSGTLALGVPYSVA